MSLPRPLLNTSADLSPNTRITIDGAEVPAHSGALLIEVINLHREAVKQRPLPQVCYVPQIGPIESCDTCIVQVDGTLARACGTQITAGMNIVTTSDLVDVAQREAFDRILQNHDLYCTVCDNRLIVNAGGSFTALTVTSTVAVAVPPCPSLIV